MGSHESKRLSKRPCALRQSPGLLASALAVAMLVAATRSAAQTMRVPKPGPLVYAWLDGSTVRSHVYVKLPDEPDARLIYDEPGIISQAKWSPDGEQIAFDDDGLLVMNADGSDLRRLTDAEFWARPPFTWGPEDHQITYYKPKAQGDGDLWILDARNPENERNLTRQGGGFAGPAWSPDRSRIAYSWGPVGGGTLYVMDADGGNIMVITQGRYPSWSPDGNRLVFTRHGNGLATDVYVVDAREGAAPQRLTQAPYYKYSPVWVADGPWIAYGESGDLHLISLDGREAHKMGVRKGIPAITNFDWFDPFRAVSAEGRLPSRWGSLKARETP